jgi:cob(I)alamin adenosyltransferase
MAEKKRSTAGGISSKRLQELAEVLEEEAARLAGIENILELAGETSKEADALGVARDVARWANDRISAVAGELRNAESVGVGR